MRSAVRRKPSRPTILGESFQGGFWGGDITFGGDTYAIIVAPKAVGEKTATKLVGQAVNTPGAASFTDAVANTTYLASLTSTSASAAAAFVKGLNVGGFNDWQIPSKNVLEALQTKLRPNGASTPAIYKTGGSEAFATNVYYWSSTTYDWSQQGSYTTGGDPIYGESTSTTSENHSFNYGPTGESVDYSGYITCGSDDGPYNVSGPNFSPSGNNIGDDRIGYYSASWTCRVTKTTTTVVGYTPTETHYYTDYYYQAYSVNFAGNGSVVQDKITALNIRAVRLVKVA
jgi:hypothetical protein